MSNIFSKTEKTKWKILSFALMGILAAGFAAPQAFAATTDSILTIVKDIQAKINSSVFGLSAIKSAVDTKASQTSVNNVKTVVDDLKARPEIKFAKGNVHFNVPSGGFEEMPLIGETNENLNLGTVVSGHITAVKLAGSSDRAFLRCYIADKDAAPTENGSTQFYLGEIGDAYLNTDFSCHGLSITLSDEDGVGDEIAVLYTLQYAETAHAEEIDTNPT